MKKDSAKGFHQTNNWWACLSALIAILTVATVIRIYGALNDLWLDEIWSLELVGQLSSPLGVFTGIHHDNNHYLNSLWLYWSGMKGNWLGYRALSIVAGVGSVIVAGMIGRRRNVPAAFFAMSLVAFSYVQVLYSSEARGYSAVVFFSFLSFFALEGYLQKQRWQSALLFSISSICGFASHLTFLNFFCAALLWSGWQLIKSRLGLKRTVNALLACHAAPSIFITTLYFVDLQHMTIGGGTAAGLPRCYASSLAWALGLSQGYFTMWSACLAVAGLFSATIWIQRCEKYISWPFYFGVILVIPVLLAIVRDSNVLYVRYFIIGMAFFLILLSYALSFLFQRSLLGRIVSVLLLAVFIAINTRHTISLLNYGRGNYEESVRLMVNHSQNPTVTIGSDHDFRILMVLQFYCRQASVNKEVEYFKQGYQPASGIEWFISHKESFEAPTPPTTQLVDNTGNRYELLHTFPSAPLSGLHWFIYHKQAN